MLLRKKLKKYKAKVEQESAVNKELARRLAEHKAKYEEEEGVRTYDSRLCNLRKFAMTLQVHPNNHANRRHNVGENIEAISVGDEISSNQSNTPSNMYMSGHSAILRSVRQKLTNRSRSWRSTFHTIWDIPSSELLDRCNVCLTLFFIVGRQYLMHFEAFDAAPDQSTC